MTPFVAGFSDELTKTAFVRAIGKTIAKHPGKALGASFLPIATYGGYQQGRAVGQGARYLAASKRGPSKAAFINFHKRLGLGRVPDKQVKKLSKNYRPEAFA